MTVKIIKECSFSLLMNHFDFYFDWRLNSDIKNKEILQDISKSSCIKFFAYIDRLSRLYKTVAKKKNFLAKIIQTSLKEFCLYCCYLQETCSEKIFYSYYM